MAYSLSTSYVGESLISGFKWHHGRDLSNGFVSYKSQQDALDLGLYEVDPLTNVVRLGVDSKNKYDLWEGRPSVRLESKEAYNHGLFIADFLHMPPSQCGVWPAFWAYGSPWPNGGEIDIIEGANMAYSNIISAHTSDGCFLDPATEGLFTGERRNLDCAIGTMNVGCGYNPPESDVSSYGDGFNAANGGVYAMEWDSDYIKVWHFPRGSIPSDIEAKKPEPQGWGLPQALFGGSACDVDSYFKNMNIVININFCGDYGAATWRDFPTCAGLADSCAEYVGDNPEAFKNAYWDVKYIDVYDFDETLLDDGSASETASDDLPTSDTIFNTFGTALSNSTLGVFPTGTMSQNTTDDSTSTTTRTSTTTTTVTVTPTFTPAPESNVPANPARIGDYAYLGCFGSSTGFQTFNFTQESSQMTIKRCIDACAGIRYAGLFEGNCYCASELDADTRAVADEGSCDRPCPGNSTEFCGGFAGTSNAKSRRFMLRRDAPSTSLLTVYADLTENEPPAQPPAIGPAPSVPAPTTTVTYTKVVTLDAQVQTQRYIQLLTLEDCGCEYPTYVAMPAATEVCDVCEAEGVTTITVPVVPVRVTTTAPSMSTLVASAADAASQTEAAPAGITQASNHTYYYSAPSNGSYAPDEPVIVTAGTWSWREVRMSAAAGGVLVALIAAML